jgi:hypothetical protein
VPSNPTTPSKQEQYLPGSILSLSYLLKCLDSWGVLGTLPQHSTDVSAITFGMAAVDIGHQPPQVSVGLMSSPIGIQSGMTTASGGHQPQVSVGLMSTPVGMQAAPATDVSTMGSGIPVSPPVAGLSTANVSAQYPLSMHSQGSVLAGVSGDPSLIEAFEMYIDDSH